MTVPRWFLAGLFVLILLVFAGCKKEEKPTMPAGPAPGSGPGPEFPPILAAPLPETEPHMAGKKVFNANGCFRCHTVGGVSGPPTGGPPVGGPPVGGPPVGGPPVGGPPVGGPPVGGPPVGGPPMREKGPDLGKAASKPERDVKWFMDFVSDSRKINPDSKMPPFGDKIKAEDLKALAEFLASLK